MKKAWKTVMIVTSVVAALAVGAFFAYKYAGAAIVNRYMLLTKSDEEYFKWLAGKYVDAIALGAEAAASDEAQDNGILMYAKQPAAYELSLDYGTETLLGVKTYLDLQAGELFFEVPQLVDGPVSCLDTVKSAVPEYTDGLGTVTDTDEAALRAKLAAAPDLIRKYGYFIIDSISSVTVERDCREYVSEEQVVYNKVTVKLSGDELKSIAEGILGYLKNDIEDIDLSDYVVMDEVAEWNGKLALCVKNDAMPTGIYIEAGHNETKIGLDLLGTAVDGKLTGKTAVTVNGLEGLTGTYTIERPGEGISAESTLKVGSFLTQLAGLKYGVTLRIGAKLGENSWNGFDRSGACEITEVMEKGRTSLQKLIGYGIHVVDTLDNAYVYSFVDDILPSVMSGMTLDTVRMMYEMGMFDTAPADTPVGNSPVTGTQSDAQPATTATPVPTPTTTPVPTKAPDKAVTPEPTQTPVSDMNGDTADGQNVEGQPDGGSDISGSDTETGQAYTEEELSWMKAGFLAKHMNEVRLDPAALTVDYGDEIIMDIVPVFYGMLMTGMGYEDMSAVIGEYLYGEGMDDEVIGMRIGDFKDITVTIGEDVPELSDYAGMTVTVRVTVKDIIRYITPEWTEEFLGMLGYTFEDFEKDSLSLLTDVDD